MKTVWIGLAAAALALIAALAAGVLWARFAGWPVGEAGPAIVAIADVASERLTPLGPVVGIAGPSGSHAWLGIPYARAPIGALRWRAPQPPEAWTEPFDALVRSPRCLRLADAPADEDPGEEPAVSGSEDCLALDVWAPRFEPDGVPAGDARLPVMVWVRGAGRAHTTAAPVVDGSQLATRHHVIVVALEYRVGPLGWFAHPALAAEAVTAEDRSGNFGTLDLIAGLRWVRDHVESFGGDPGNVTVFGESDGAIHVQSLLAARPAAGLFHRAIVQSGGPVSYDMASASHYVDDPLPGHRHSASEIALRLLIDDGTASDRASAREFIDGLDPAQVAGFLRAQSAEALVRSYAEPSDPGQMQLPVVLRDGVVIDARPPLELYTDARRYNAVPIVLGEDRDTAKWRMMRDPALVSRRFGWPFRVRDAARYERLAFHASAIESALGVDEPARRLRSAQGPTVFAYRFDWDEQPVFFGVDLGRMIGAARGLEVPFVFGRFELSDPRWSRIAFSEDDLAGRLALSEAMGAYWAEFARTGDPGSGGDADRPAWLAWGDAGREGTARGPRRMVFDTPRGGGLRMIGDERTVQQALDALAADPGLDRANQCAVWSQVLRFAPEARALDAWRMRCTDVPPPP